MDTGLTDGNLTVIEPTAVAPPANRGNDTKGVNGFTAYWDGPAGAPWLYNPLLDGGTFVSFVDPHAVVDRWQTQQRAVTCWGVAQCGQRHIGMPGW